MCGRSSLTQTEKEIEARFNATFYSDELERYNPLPNYNVAPTQLHPVITNLDPNKLQLFKWGLIPNWAKDSKIGPKLINARSETVTEKVSFKKAIQQQRCLVPLDAYYEWIKDGKAKLPYRISTSDQTIFSVAGLWEKWLDNQRNTVMSFTILTQNSNEKLKHIHNRMPVILNIQQEALWLDNSIPVLDLLDMIKEPYPSELTRYRSISQRINKIGVNDPDLIIEVKDHIEQKNKGTLF